MENDTDRIGERAVAVSATHALLAMTEGAIQALMQVHAHSSDLRPTTIESVRKVEAALLSTISGVVVAAYTLIDEDDHVPDILIKLMMLHQTVAAILGEDRFEAALRATSPSPIGFASPPRERRA